MKIKEVILERIPKEDVSKLNVMSFHLKVSEPSSRFMTYERAKVKSTFYNSQDLATGGFYKQTSLLINAIYEKR